MKNLDLTQRLHGDQKVKDNNIAAGRFKSDTASSNITPAAERYSSSVFT